MRTAGSSATTIPRFASQYRRSPNNENARNFCAVCTLQVGSPSRCEQCRRSYLGRLEARNVMITPAISAITVLTMN